MNMFPSTAENKFAASAQTKQAGRSEETSGSQSVASCLMKESCILRCPIGNVWEEFKNFRFDSLAPSIISSVKFLSGKANEIGSTYQIQYKDGSSVTYMIVELSEIKRSISIDMIDCNPKQSFSSMLTTLKLCKVSHDDCTFFSWEALFSNDINTNILQCKKERVNSLFCDLKKYFEKTEKKF